MRSILLASALATLALAACGRKSTSPDTADLCARGVSHVTQLLTAPPGTPSADEQRAIDAIKQMSITRCQEEGLTQAQLDCLLAAKDWAAFKELGSCAAIKDRKPGWLILP